MKRFAGWILFVAWFVTLSAPASAQKPPTEPPRTPEAKDGLPFWTQPSADERQQLGRNARACERGIFIVGFGKEHGTAWVISKKNRLLITNAHVADIRHVNGGKMSAIPSGTSQVYNVEKVWYHPGVRRHHKNLRQLSVRSMDPKDGDVDPCSPDLAILQLSAEGPELTFEFPIASAGDLKELYAQPAAIIGFPGHDSAFPATGEKPAPTFHDGVISRVTDFQLGTSVPEAEQQFVQYTMSTWGGYSGSPVFLPNGRVVAVHNMSRNVPGRGQVKSIPHGIRVDCVAEMLVHHGLDNKVSFEIDKSKVLVERWTKPDIRGDKARADYAKAEELVGEARYLIFFKQKFQEGVDKCDEAVKLLPNYGEAYFVRSFGVNNYFAFHQNNLNKQGKLKLLRLAKADAQKYIDIMPSDPAGPINICQIICNIGVVRDDDEDVNNALEMLTKLLTSPNLPNHIRAQAHSYRGGAYSFIDEPKKALRDHNEALRLNPLAPVLWENRASYWDKYDREDLAEQDRAKAKEVRENSLARGMKITQILDGGVAQKAGLRMADVIISVGATRVQSLEQLMKALADANGAVTIEIINSQTRKVEKVSISPAAGKIGVAVEPVELD